MIMTLKHRHVPAIVVAGTVLVSMIICNQGNVHQWVSDIIMMLDSMALVFISIWCGITELLRHFG